MKKKLHHVQKFLKSDLWKEETIKCGRLKRYGIKTLRFFDTVFERFNAAKCPLQAAGLTYFTLMALVPILCLLLLLARTLGAGEFARDKINEQISIMIDNIEKGQEDNLVKRDQAIIEARKKQAKDFAEKARAISNEMFDKINSFDVSTLGYLGLGMIFWTIISTLSTVETSFNTIWRVHKPRPIWKRFYLYAFISIILPVLISLAMSLPILRFIKNALISIMGITSATKIAGEFIINFLNSTFISTTITLIFAILAFAVFFSFMPNRKVSFRSSFFAGIITAILFFFWMKLCAITQIGIANANAFYGSFAFFPIILTWAYISWQIVLIGGSMTYAFECVHRRTRHLPYA